jgi:hypothetical protein
MPLPLQHMAPRPHLSAVHHPNFVPWECRYLQPFSELIELIDHWVDKKRSRNRPCRSKRDRSHRHQSHVIARGKLAPKWSVSEHQ